MKWPAPKAFVGLLLGGAAGGRQAGWGSRQLGYRPVACLDPRPCEDLWASQVNTLLSEPRFSMLCTIQVHVRCLGLESMGSRSEGRRRGG